MKKIIPFILFCLTTTTFADVLTDVSFKRIGIRPAQADFKVELFSKKTSYHVNETIILETKGNKPFYLYLLFKDQDNNNKAVSILPNKLQKNHRYSANKRQAVLNSEVQFFSDRKGTEHLLMIASIKPLNVTKLLRKSSTKSIGYFYQLDNPDAAIEEMIAETYQKRILIRSTQSQLPAGLVLKALDLKIN